MSTITTDQQQAISRLVSEMTLTEGLGNEENSCSIAAINLALTGELTDNIPPCMSEVIGSWIIGVQDVMPSQMRNSAEWKRLLPLAAGTGREREYERQAIVMESLWSDVLPTLQPLADRCGFGEEWRTMLEQRTESAAARAARGSALCAVYAVGSATRAAASAASAAAAAARGSAAAAARRSAAAARAASTTTAADDVTATWQQFNPCGLLQRLIAA